MYGTNPYQSYPYGNGYGMQNNYMQRPYASQPQQMPQPQPQMQPQMQMTYEVPIQDVRFVTSEEAKAYIVMPNSKALLIDKNGGVAHLKSADNMGQSQTHYFRFEPINADGTPIKPQEATPQIDLEAFGKKFVTVEQYSDLLAQFNQLKEMLQRKPTAQQDQSKTITQTKQN
jgi:hypothetical protein